MPRLSTRPSTTSAPTHELYKGRPSLRTWRGAAADQRPVHRPNSWAMRDSRASGAMTTTGDSEKLRQTGGPHRGTRRRTHSAGGYWSGSVVSHHDGPPPDSVRCNHADSRHPAEGSGRERGVASTAANGAERGRGDAEKPRRGHNALCALPEERSTPR